MKTDPAVTLASCLAKFDPEIQQQATSWLKRLRELVPGANQLVYDAYNALAIPFGTSERLGDCFVGLAIYPKHVNVTFPRGAELADEDGLLVGDGSKMRHVRAEPELLRDRRIARLVRDAAARAGFEPVRGAKGELIVKKIYANQRPRRAKR